MTAIALNARRDTHKFGSGLSPDRVQKAVLATTQIKAGSLVVGNSAGTCEPGRTATGLVALGRAEAQYDNTLSLSPAPVALIETGIFDWENGDAITDGDTGKTCYVVDDQTVSLDGTGKSPAGTIMGLTPDGKVMVATSPLLPITGTTGAYPLNFETKELQLADMAAGQGTGADTNGTARVYNLGAALPAGAILQGYMIHLVAAAVLTGGLTMKVGTSTDDDAICTTFDTEGAPGYGQGTPGDDYVGLMPVDSQLVVTLTPDGSHKVSAATGIHVKVTVFYIDATGA